MRCRQVNKSQNCMRKILFHAFF